MDLLVIVLCLLSERFLVHKVAHHRFHWFMSYGNRVLAILPVWAPWLLLALIILPLLLFAGAVLHIVSHLFFDMVGLLFNVAIFYYCIGPVNPFYPVHVKPVDQMDDGDMGNYLAQANGELFAVLFWYLVLGPVGILAYRLISLSRGLTMVSRQASDLLELFDWLPARMTALLYLLVGNFQSGYQHYHKLFFSSPDKSHTLLTVCGMAAIDSHEQKTMLNAENLVEHATIVFLVLLAFCTIVAWM